MSFSSGQKQASRVNKLIQSCTSRIKKLFEEYQEVQRNANGEVSSASVKDVCNLKSSFWVTEHSYPITGCESRIPVSSQRQFIELCDLIDRTCEEQQLSISDMIRTLMYYRNHLEMATVRLLQYISRYDADSFQPYSDRFFEEYLSPVVDYLPTGVAGYVAALLNLLL